MRSKALSLSHRCILATIHFLPSADCAASFLKTLQRESKDVIEIIRQFVSMLRFIAELPETLQQLAGREKEKLERELQKLLRLVEEFKEAIRGFADDLAVALRHGKRLVIILPEFVRFGSISICILHPSKSQWAHAHDTHVCSNYALYD